MVANGLEPVEVMTRIAYDCVFMDCQMPEMDAYAATSMIRRREALTGAHSKPSSAERHGRLTVARSGVRPRGLPEIAVPARSTHYLFGAKLDTPGDPRL
jgi:CheY-like chemotaxis protein